MDAQGYLVHPQAAHGENWDEIIESTETGDSFEGSVISDVLQYVYQHNLTTDHLLNSFSLSHLFGDLIKTTFPESGEDGFTDPKGLTELEVPDILLRENLSLTDPACRLICEASRVPKDDEVQELTQRAQQYTSTKNRKLELPILRSDNDCDLKKFKKEQLARFHVPIKDHRLPLDTPDNDAGEGMDLQASIRLESELFSQKLRGEKLGVTKDALKFLAEQLRVDVTREDLVSYLLGGANYVKVSSSEAPGNPALEKITPPVSPKLGQNYFVPPTGACLIPIPSDDSSLLSDNFKAIEDDLLTDYQDQWSETMSPVRELLEAEYSTKEGASLLQDSGVKLDDMKVEIPLMLDSASEQPVISGEVLFKGSSFLDAALGPDFEEAVPMDLPDDFLGRDFSKVAEEVARTLEQEQLQQVDGVARVPIPVLDFSIPEPGWVQLRMNGRGIYKWTQAGKEELFKSPKWPVHKANESKLIWKPLGAGVTLTPEEESLDYGKGLVETFTEVTDGIGLLTSADFVHKSSGFVVLKNDEEEEIDTQLVMSKPRKDLMDIVRKRSHDGIGMTAQKKPRRVTNERSTDQSNQFGSLDLLLGNSPGASGKLLANFMQIHVPKKKWSQSRYFASQQNEAAERTVVEETDTSNKSSDGVQSQQLEDPVVPSTISRVKAPCPEITLPGAPLTIFISIQISRHLIRTLETLIPDLAIVERDYDAYNTSVWRPDSVTRSVIVPPMADDADITVSPSTGIIITNMIKVRQKPRAGMNKNVVQTRIEKASLRYSQLVVLVGGEGGIDDALLQMSPSDAAVLTELQGFATGLDCDIHVHYIGGGDSTLSTWVVFGLCRYGIPEHSLQTNLFEVETLWELFLRRAGFNVYAAQAVASQLKPPGLNGEMAQPEGHGLGAFVTMTRAERLRKFGQIVGPRVVERVSAAIDEVWNRG